MKTIFRINLLLILFLLLTTPLLPQNLLLKDKFLLSEPGDFIVTEQNDIYSLLHIREKTNTHLILEEISIPKKLYLQQKTTWRKWVEDTSTNFTSWVIFDLNNQTNTIEEIWYSKRAEKVRDEISKCRQSCHFFLNCSFEEKDYLGKIFV